jgi:erythrocyte band 7 integral membrane protein
LQVITADGEVRAAQALRAAADGIASSPGAVQLRYLQTLYTVAAQNNTTIVIPIPVNRERGKSS